MIKLARREAQYVPEVLPLFKSFFIGQVMTIKIIIMAYTLYDKFLLTQNISVSVCKIYDFEVIFILHMQSLDFDTFTISILIFTSSVMSQ